VNASTQETWYVREGPQNDVVLSSRVRVARNLSGFTFPGTIKSDDAERVVSLVFDAFNHCRESERYQMVRMSALDPLGKRILAERGIVAPESGNEPWRGIVIRSDGMLSATVNMTDHVKLSCFSAGLSLDGAFAEAGAMEGELASRLQFSAANDFGYLTANLADSGSGVKASALLCLPGMCMGGLIERAIREYLGNGYVVQGYYSQSGDRSMGYLYRISGASASTGDGESQIRRVEQGAAKLAELERKTRRELYAQRPTQVEDAVYRSIVTAKYARLIGFAESVEILGNLRLGVDLKLLTGIGAVDLTALLYRVQNAHLGFVISGGSIIIEGDVQSEESRLDRLRAMVIQEVLKDADIRERR